VAVVVECAMVMLWLWCVCVCSKLVLPFVRHSTKNQ